jgi:uncharacterized phage protein (TIGR01671 family)
MNLKKQTQTRQIKFRAWNPDDKRIEYPLVFAICSNGKLQPLIKCSDGNRAYKDYPIMQYTGLTDKNGKEIYEGDIVQRGVITFSRGKFQGTYFDSNGDFAEDWEDDLCQEKDIEVLGNIFENPELLQS